MSSEQITESSSPLYDRIVIKISGESLGEYNLLEPKRFAPVAQMIAAVHSMGVTVTVVTGGGNIFRGTDAERWELEREEADRIGMFATGINVFILRGMLRKLGLATAVFSRGPIESAGQPYNREHVRAALQRKEVVLLAGGLGVPGISTDVAAVEAAIDTGAPAVIMSKHDVDGVYTSDPHGPYGADAVFMSDLTVSEALERELQITDFSALRRARDYGKLIHVIPAKDPFAPCEVLKGEDIGSRIIPV